jgi:hypothetical protein
MCWSAGEPRAIAEGQQDAWDIFDRSIDAQVLRLRTPAGSLRLHDPDKVRGEWSLATMAWNMKRMFALTEANY